VKKVRFGFERVGLKA